MPGVNIPANEMNQPSKHETRNIFNTFMINFLNHNPL